MDKETTIYDFKTHLSSYIAALEAGEYDRIIVRRRNVPVGEFTLRRPEAPRRIKLGALREPGFTFDKVLFDSADDEIADLMNYGPVFPAGYDEKGDEIEDDENK